MSFVWYVCNYLTLDEVLGFNNTSLTSWKLLGEMQIVAQAQAGLLSKDAVTNARALLRYALPIDEKNAKPIRQIQVSI